MRSSTELISSPSNRWLKEFRRALRESHPAPDDLIALEGPHLIEEALRSGLTLESLLVSPAGERLLSRLGPLLKSQPAIKILRTSDRLFSSLSDTQSPQGIAALLRQPAHTLADILAGTQPLVVVLVGVQDPGNVGAILRSAEAFSASGVIATGIGAQRTAHPFAQKVLRASAGSALRLPVILGASAPVVLAQLRLSHLKIFATVSVGAGLAPPSSSASRKTSPQPPVSPEGTGFSPSVTRAQKNQGLQPLKPDSSEIPTLSPSSADLSGPVALLIGNEGAGLPAEISNSADALLRIPISPRVDSLNAAIATSLILYEVSRQRGLPSDS